jgi:hypothetical protein
VNTFETSVKRKYAQEVWDMLQSSYAYIGGIKGDEFKTPEAMLSVPFWKLVIRGGKIVTCRLYKDKNGRKSVAGGTDGTKLGKVECAKMMEADFKRSYSEVSGAAEQFVKRHFPALYKKYSIPADQVEALIDKKIEPLEDGYHYKRLIDGDEITKICLGTPHQKFY